MSTVYGITPAFKGISGINYSSRASRVSFGEEPEAIQEPPAQPEAEQQTPTPEKKSHLLLWLAGLAVVGAAAFLFLKGRGGEAEKAIVQTTKKLMKDGKEAGECTLHHEEGSTVVNKIEVPKLDKDKKPVVDKDGKPETEEITDPAAIAKFLKEHKVDDFKAPEVKPAAEVKTAPVNISANGFADYTVHYTEKDGVKTITEITYKAKGGTVSIKDPAKIKKHYEELTAEDKEKLKDYKLPEEVKPAEENK